MIEDYSEFLHLFIAIALITDIFIKIVLFLFFKHENKKVSNLLYYSHHEIIILTRDRKYLIPGIQNSLTITGLVLFAFYILVEIFIFS